MGRYLLLWQLENTRVPEKAKDRAMGWGMFVETIKKDMKDGIQRDWGAYVGEGRGYGIVEGNEIEVAALINQYSPYIRFEVKPLLTIEQTEEFLKTIK
jgi:hypothetical protein